MARLHLRLNKTDMDLHLLFSHYNASDLISSLIRAYIRGEEHRIPLPPMANVKRKARGVMIYLQEPRDNDIIDWIKSLTPGLATTALKNLIRWSLEAPDLRLFEATETNVRPVPERRTVQEAQYPSPAPKTEKHRPEKNKIAEEVKSNRPAPAETDESEKGSTVNTQGVSPMDLI